MNHFAFFFAFSLLGPVWLNAAPTEDLITDIRSKYNAIENASLKSETIRFAPQDDPMEGTMKRYFSDGELVKISLSYTIGDHGGADETYYYSGGQLFFAFITDSSWGFTGKTLSNGESETVDTVSEHRMYFANGQLIRYLRKSVETKDPDGAAKALAKAENEPYTDPEFAQTTLRRAMGAPSVTSAAGIESLLTAE